MLYMRDERLLLTEKLPTSIPPPTRRDHMGNFLDAIRGQAELACNEDLGCALMVAIKMGVDAYRYNRTMLWDPERQRCYSA